MGIRLIKRRIQYAFLLEIWLDSKIEYSPFSQGGILWNVLGFLVHAKLAHRTLCLASK